MATVERYDDEMTISEAARLLWSQRSVIVLAFVIGLLLVYPTVKMFPGATTRVVSLEIYPSGTPIDTVEDIRSQLITTLTKSGFAAAETDESLQIDLPYNVETPATVATEYRNIEKAVAEYQKVLLAKVANGRATLERYKPSSEDTVALYLRYLSFDAGVANGTVVPVRVTKADVDTRKKTFVKIAIGLPILSLLVGIFLAWVSALIKRDRTP